MKIETPKLFSFEQCLHYLGRSELENLHRIKDGAVIKLLEIGSGLVLIKIQPAEVNHLRLSCLNTRLDSTAQSQLLKYINQWFDLDTPLEEFYRVAEADPILKDLIKKYHGLRLIKALDLFEAMSWAIIGQQINLRFAYLIKNKLVERCGQVIDFAGDKFYMFPRPEVVLELSEGELKKMQFSRQKIRYIREVAEMMAAGIMSKVQLQNLSETEVKQWLLQIKGIGNWSANYVMMRCFNFNDAFPVEDVGLHNALKKVLGLDQKPSMEMIHKYALGWGDWKAYATYYLWRSLLS